MFVESERDGVARGLGVFLDVGSTESVFVDRQTTNVRTKSLLNF